MTSAVEKMESSSVRIMIEGSFWAARARKDFAVGLCVSSALLMRDRLAARRADSYAPLRKLTKQKTNSARLSAHRGMSSCDMIMRGWFLL